MTTPFFYYSVAHLEATISNASWKKVTFQYYMIVAYMVIILPCGAVQMNDFNILNWYFFENEWNLYL